MPPLSTHAPTWQNEGLLLPKDPKPVLVVLLLLSSCASIPGPRGPTGPDGPFARPPAQQQAPFLPPTSDRPWIAIVIDDLGDSVAQIKPFLDIPLPLAFAILPDAASARQMAKTLDELGREFLVHVPMEPNESQMLLPYGCLLTSMDSGAIRKASALALAKVPGAIGVNNHMGSRFTRSRDALRPFMEILLTRGLFFLDSRTDPGTVAEEVAIEAGVPALRRSVFLDNIDQPEAIDAMLESLVVTAKTRGCAIGIGHDRPPIAEALGRFARSANKGVEVVPISMLVGRACARGERTAPAINAGQNRPE
jgi:polysaccharide deacetylase 2 family uncharacterized protein YibQ